MKNLLLILCLGLGSLAAQGETGKADAGSTQVVQQTTPTGPTSPPLSSQVAADVVALLVDGKEISDLGTSKEGRSVASVVEYSGDRPAAMASIRAMASATASSLNALKSIENGSIGEMVSQTQEAAGLLALAMEKAETGNKALLSLSAKGAINQWNTLVNNLLNRLEAIYKEPSPNTQEFEAIRNFLVDPKTIEFRGVLAGFSESKSKP